MTKTKKVSLFICEGVFTLNGVTFRSGDPFDPPAGWTIVPHPKSDRPEAHWNGVKFHCAGSQDGGTVQDDYMIGGAVETAPTHQPFDEILPVRLRSGRCAVTTPTATGQEQISSQTVLLVQQGEKEHLAFVVMAAAKEGFTYGDPPRKYHIGDTVYLVPGAPGMPA